MYAIGCESSQGLQGDGMAEGSVVDKGRNGSYTRDLKQVSGINKKNGSWVGIYTLRRYDCLTMA